MGCMTGMCALTEGVLQEVASAKLSGSSVFNWQLPVWKGKDC